MKGTFSVSSRFGKNAINFEADMTSSVHVDNNKKYISCLNERITQGLYDTTLTSEKKFSINFTEHNKKFCLSWHDNGANSYLFLNGVEIIRFKAKNCRNSFMLINMTLNVE